MPFPHRLRRFGAGALAACLSVPLAGAQQPLELDQQASEIGFAVKQMGVTVEGRFADWEADIALDETDPANSRARLVVRTASIATGHSDTEREVRKPEWLAVEAFPEAVFEAERVTRRDDGEWLAEGTLRIRDEQREVAVPFRLEEGDDGRRRMRGQFAIQRDDYGVGGGEWSDVVANEVRIDFTLATAP